MCTTSNVLIYNPMLFQLVNMFSQYFFVAIASELWCLLQILFSLIILTTLIALYFFLADYLIVAICFILFFGCICDL